MLPSPDNKVTAQPRPVESTAASRFRGIAIAVSEELRSSTSDWSEGTAEETAFQELRPPPDYDREGQAIYLNHLLAQTLAGLNGLLKIGLVCDVRLDFRSLLKKPEVPPLILNHLQEDPPKKRLEDFLPPPPKKWIAWVPWVENAYEKDCKYAKQKFADYKKAYIEDCKSRRKQIRERKEAHARDVAEIKAQTRAHNEQIQEWYRAIKACRGDALIEYLHVILGRAPYPFQRSVKLAYLADSKQLVLEFDLPTLDSAIPEVKQYTYVKKYDNIKTSSESEKNRQALYKSVIAQVVLRTIHEIFTGDVWNHIETIVFNGYVDAIDRATGQKVRPCVVTVRTTKEQFSGLDLWHVDPQECLKSLSAIVSKSPSELAAVRPILDLNMCDPRFVEEADVLSTLDQRPNLLELTPNEFESLITNLFQQMGLDTKQTQASRDGGVDCVAFDPRPIFGGKVVIQAKRYKDTVGVADVRDLYGTMLNEGASKGILVTTSGFGKAAFQFAQGKPLGFV